MRGKVKMVMVYMTAGNRAQATRIAEVLVAERLAACVNILGPISSIYRWKGALERGREVAFIAKTRAALFPRLRARVAAMHDYEVPCVVALDLTQGHPAFLAWLAEQTQPIPGGARRAGRSGSGNKATA